MKQYQDDETMLDDINGQDDGVPMLCYCCGGIFEMHEGSKSLHSNHAICPGCHVDEMIESEKA